MKRRAFLQSLGAIPLLTTFSGSVWAGSERATLQSWRTGMSVSGYSDATFEKIGPLREAGFDCIQLSLPFSKWSDEKTIDWLKRFRAACDAKQLGIEYVHVPFSGSFDISLLDDAKREKVLADVCKLMDWNQYMKAPVFVIHPSAEPIADDIRAKRIDNSVASLRRLNAEAKKHGIRLAVENLPRTCLGNTSKEMNEIIARSGDDMQICFDTNHLLKETPEQFLANFKGKIAAIHVSDYDYIDERHWIPFEGKCDWKAILRELLRHQYKGPFMFESIRLNDGKVAGFPEAMSRWTRIQKMF